MTRPSLNTRIYIESTANLLEFQHFFLHATQNWFLFKKIHIENFRNTQKITINFDWRLSSQSSHPIKKQTFKYSKWIKRPSCDNNLTRRTTSSCRCVHKSSLTVLRQLTVVIRKRVPFIRCDFQLKKKHNIKYISHS